MAGAAGPARTGAPRPTDRSALTAAHSFRRFAVPFRARSDRLSPCGRAEPLWPHWSSRRRRTAAPLRDCLSIAGTFSKAVHCVDLRDGGDVCIKIIKYAALTPSFAQKLLEASVGR